MSLTIEFSNRAAKHWRALDRSVQQRVKERLRELQQKPSDPRISKQLVKPAGARSSRVGDWRIIYHLREATLLVISIEPRGQVYKHL